MALWGIRDQMSKMMRIAVVGGRFGQSRVNILRNAKSLYVPRTWL